MFKSGLYAKAGTHDDETCFPQVVDARPLNHYLMDGSWHSITLAFQSTSTGKRELWRGLDLTSLEQEALG